jgi:hypothetical protein
MTTQYRRQSELARLRAAVELLWSDEAQPNREDTDDELPWRIVDAATVLVGGASHVALGLARSSAPGARVVHRGMSEDLVERLRGLTAGDSVLDDLTEASSIVPEPRAANLDVDRASRRSSPEMVLGAPIRTDSGIYAHLYVVNDRGASDAVGGDLMAVFAAMAGAAVAQAQSDLRARQQRRWEAAALRLLAGLLRQADDDEAAGWHQLVSIVAEAADAHGVAITIVDPDNPTTVTIPASVGGMEPWSGRRIPRENSITHTVVTSGRPLIIADAALDARTAGVADRAPEVGPIAAAPVLDGGEECVGHERSPGSRHAAVGPPSRSGFKISLVSALLSRVRGEVRWRNRYGHEG